MVWNKIIYFWLNFVYYCTNITINPQKESYVCKFGFLLLVLHKIKVNLALIIKIEINLAIASVLLWALSLDFPCQCSRNSDWGRNEARLESLKVFGTSDGWLRKAMDSCLHALPGNLNAFQKMEGPELLHGSRAQTMLKLFYSEHIWGS